MTIIIIIVIITYLYHGQTAFHILLDFSIEKDVD